MNKFVWLFITSISITSFSAEVYFTPSQECEDRITAAIKLSKKKIVVAVYSINNKKIVNALIDAHKRGVKLRVLTDSLQAAGHSSRVFDLEKAGIDMRLHSVSKIMHNKFSVFDEAASMTGSFNWTEPASKQNSENCVFFNEKNVTDAYSKRFEELWKSNTESKSKIKIAKIKDKRGLRKTANEE